MREDLTKHYVRTKERLRKYGDSNKSYERWSALEHKRFVRLSEEKTDVQLTRIFGRSLASIQSERRKIRLASILNSIRNGNSKSEFQLLIENNEQKLRAMIKKESK